MSPRTRRSSAVGGAAGRRTRLIGPAVEIDVEEGSDDSGRDIAWAESGCRLAVLGVLGVEHGLAGFQVRRRVAVWSGAGIGVVVAFLDDHPVKAADVDGGIGGVGFLGDRPPVA